MASPATRNETPNKALFWGFIFVALLPWLYFRTQQTVHPDMLWLYECMTRIFHGGTMSGQAFETNPPLSLLLYFIPVTLKEYLDWPFHITGLAQSLAILTAGGAALGAALKRFAFLSEAHQLTILLGYIVANTICTNMLFGERDHLIAMILPGFALWQVLLTQQPERRPGLLTWAYLFLSSILLLLKPHYGILPVVILLHRLWQRGFLQMLRSPDFIALSISTIAYAALIWFAFRDYLEVILPDVIQYYLPMSVKGANLWPIVLTFLIVGAGLLTIAKFAFTDKNHRQFYMMMTGFGLVSLIAVIAQNKGFPYHYFPTLAFYGSVAAPCLYDWVLKQSRHAFVSLYLTFAAFFGLTYAASPLDPTHATHTSFRELPLPTLVEGIARNHNSDSFFIFNSNMSLMQEVAYYTGLDHASRFPALWFLPRLYYFTNELNEGRLTPLQEAKLEADIYRYGSMMAEDLNSYKPGVVLVLTEDSFKTPVNPLKFFGGHKGFKQAWSHYELTGTTTLDEGEYYGHMILDAKAPKTFDIYARKAEANHDR